MSLTGKVAVITGGGQGTGLAAAERFVQAGATVIIAEIDALAGAMAADALEATGDVHFLDADVASEPSVKAVVERVVMAHGRMDFLIQCASADRPAPVTELSLEDWCRVVAVNLTGAFLFARYAAGHLAAAKGAIVHIAATRSVASHPQCEAYAASKAGLVGLTEALAASLAPDVRVNCISPAADGDVVSPDEIAKLVVELCSGGGQVPSGRNIVLRAA